MTIELPASVEKELNHFAVMQHRNIGELVEEAVRQYIEAAAICDLDSSAIGEAQVKLAGELREIAEWESDRTGASRSMRRQLRQPPHSPSESLEADHGSL